MTPRLRGRNWQNICAQVYAAHARLTPEGKPVATCHICGDDIDLTLRWPDRWSKSVDHIIPLSLGGTNAMTNLAPAHLTHNSGRGSRPLRRHTSVDW